MCIYIYIHTYIHIYIYIYIFIYMLYNHYYCSTHIFFACLEVFENDQIPVYTFAKINSTAISELYVLRVTPQQS